MNAGEHTLSFLLYHMTSESSGKKLSLTYIRDRATFWRIRIPVAPLIFKKIFAHKTRVLLHIIGSLFRRKCRVVVIGAGNHVLFKGCVAATRRSILLKR